MADWHEAIRKEDDRRDERGIHIHTFDDKGFCLTESCPFSHQKRNNKEIIMGRVVSEDVYEFDNGSQLQRDPDSKEIRLVDEYGNSDELRVWIDPPLWMTGEDNTEYDEWDSHFDETDAEKREREYVVEHKGVKCLFCKSDNISNGSPDWDEPFTIKVDCDDCGKSWRDVYTLVGVVEDQ